MGGDSGGRQWAETRRRMTETRRRFCPMAGSGAPAHLLSIHVKNNYLAEM